MTRAKVVLITGCSSGFGYLTVQLLSQNGYKVYAGVRKRKDLWVFNSLTSDSRLSTILLDVTWSQKKIDRVVGEIFKKERRIDVLINNAGFGFLGPVGSFNDREVRDQFETNVFGLFKVTKAVLPHMESQKSGTIINISSSAGLFTSAYYGVYSASKFAVEALTAALRVEESLYNIHVVSVNPGSFSTNFWKNERHPQVLKMVGETPLSPTAKLTSRLRKLISGSAARRGNPDVVARTIKSIIENPNPRKNYLVGLDAVLLYWISRFFPQTILDWAIKKAVRKLA